MAASLLWFESTEIWDEVQSVDRFGCKWQMTTMALVGSAHPTILRGSMAGSVADKSRSTEWYLYLRICHKKTGQHYVLPCFCNG